MDRSELLAMFDVAWENCNILAVWQQDEADAPDALFAWAGSRGFEISGRRMEPAVAGHDVKLDVNNETGGRITVYVAVIS